MEQKEQKVEQKVEQGAIQLAAGVGYVQPHFVCASTAGRLFKHGRLQASLRWGPTPSAPSRASLAAWIRSRYPQLWRPRECGSRGRGLWQSSVYSFSGCCIVSAAARSPCAGSWEKTRPSRACLPASSSFFRMCMVTANPVC